MIEKAIAWPLLAPDAAGVVLCQVVPLEVSTLPFVPGATKVGAEVPLPKMTLLAVRVAKLVPPLATGVTLAARSFTVPAAFLKYNFSSVVLIANSPAAKLPEVGTAAAVVLWYSDMGV